MGHYSKIIINEIIKKEDITRKIDFTHLSDRDVVCPIDKIYTNLDYVDLEKIKYFKDHIQTAKLITSLKTIKNFTELYFLKNCNVYMFEEFRVVVLYLRMSKKFQIQYNPSKGSYEFFKVVHDYITSGVTDTPVSKIHLNVDLYYSPKTAISLVEMKRKRAFEKRIGSKSICGYVGAGSIYGGKNRSVIIYDNFSKSNLRLRDTTRVELRFNQASNSPVKKFSELECLKDELGLFKNVVLPATLKRIETSSTEFEVFNLYAMALRKFGCHSIAAKDISKSISRKQADALRRIRAKKVVASVDLDKLFTRYFKIYLAKPMTTGEKNFVEKVLRRVGVK